MSSTPVASPQPQPAPLQSAYPTLPIPTQLHTAIINCDSDPCNPLPDSAITQNTFYWPMHGANINFLMALLKRHPSKDMTQGSIERTALNARFLNNIDQTAMSYAELVQLTCTPLAAMLSLLEVTNQDLDQV